MILCPRCGAPSSMTSGASFTSSSYEQLASEITSRCLCSVKDQELEKMFEEVERGLEDVVKKYFPNATKEELNMMLHKMERDDPLRAQIVVRKSFIQRILDERKKRKTSNVLKEEIEERKKREKDNISGLKRIDTLFGE